MLYEYFLIIAHIHVFLYVTWNILFMAVMSLCNILCKYNYSFVYSLPLNRAFRTCPLTRVQIWYFRPIAINEASLQFMDIRFNWICIGCTLHLIASFNAYWYTTIANNVLPMAIQKILLPVSKQKTIFMQDITQFNGLVSVKLITR